MATQGYFKDAVSFKKFNSTPLRTTIETAFYGNNVFCVTDVGMAYELAKESPGTIELTGMPVMHTEELGLPEGANVLLFNDGTVVGRCSAARRIVGHPGVNASDLSTVLREAVYAARFRTMYCGEAVVGLDEDFMIKARILIPEGFENNLYSWMNNFQYLNEEYTARYAQSREIADADILVFVDPDWTHPDYPYGLAVFSPEQNCAAVLGMRYFGEIKKGTLTLAWGTAVRNGYASCHGGLKRYALKGDKKEDFVLAVFGLSGSGKSTITHAKHGGKYDITVLHDDALIVNVRDKYAIAMEPAYFDKLQDYPMGCDDNKYLISVQNCGCVRTEDGKKVVVTEDVRNGNGRAMKSKHWTPNRVDRIDEPLNAICWLMKDPTLPPVVKLTGASLAAVMGATLATKRTSAEHLTPGIDPNLLIIESYANPFRTYPLALDYERFKQLIEDGVDCYILNTGDFMGKKVQPAHTLGIIEAIVEHRAVFTPFATIPGIEYLPLSDFPVDFTDAAYVAELCNRFKDRVDFVFSRDNQKGGIDKLPGDAKDATQAVLTALIAMKEKLEA